MVVVEVTINKKEESDVGSGGTGGAGTKEVVGNAAGIETGVCEIGGGVGGSGASGDEVTGMEVCGSGETTLERLEVGGG